MILLFIFLLKPIFSLNLSLARRVLDMDGLLAIAIDPCYISKAGKKTPHIGRFWSGCAGAVKHGLEIMGIGLLDVANNKCMMLRAHQTIGKLESASCSSRQNSQ